MTAARPLPDAAESELVAAFLRAHPAWLAEHPELYRLLAPPRRVHGEVLTDHMAAMLRAERAHAADADRRRARRRRDGRAGAGGGAGADARRRSGGVRQRGTARAAGDRCRRAVRGGAAARAAITLPRGHRATPARWPRRGVSRRGIEAQVPMADAVMLHAEAARLALHDALVRVPGRGRADAAGARLPRRARAGSGAGQRRAGVSRARRGRRARALSRGHDESPLPLGALGREADASRAKGFSSTVPRLDCRRSMTGEAARQAFLDWLAQRAPRRAADGRGLWRRPGGVSRLPDRPSRRRAGPGRSCARCGWPICAPGWRMRRTRAPATPRGRGTCRRCAASTASWRAGTAWTIRR